MAISYTGKKPTPAAPAPANAAKAAPQAAKAVSATPGLKFLKRGAVAQATMAQEEKKAEMRGKNQLFRFWVPKDAEGEITFLDGDLVDGVLDIPYYHEHQVNMNGSWNNYFICTQDEEPCPICEGGTGAAYVGILTVIDHGEYTSKKDGLTHKDKIKLFVAKRDTIKLLQKQATKRGGLRGAKFEVSRTGDKSPSVGSAFEFVEKMAESQLIAAYGSKDPKVSDRSKPVDYEKYLASMYQPASELRKLGFGASAAPVGSADSKEYNL